MTVTLCMILVIGIANVLSMQVIPERAYVKYINEKYASGTKFYIRRHSRDSDYYANLEGSIEREWGNNVSVHFYFYEFLHNEYKRSFVELHYAKLCDWVRTDPYIGAGIRNSAFINLKSKRQQGSPSKNNCLDSGVLSCPFKAGFYKLNNISVPTADFPNVWPFERFRVDIVLRVVPSDEVMVELQVFSHIKQGLGK